MRNQPVAVAFPVTISDPNGEIDRLAFGVHAGDVLNAMTETQGRVGHDAKVGEFDFAGPLNVAKNCSQSLR